VCHPGELSLHDGLLDFVPSSHLPGLQYVEHVDAGSAAAEAGLLPGDFILEVALVILHFVSHHVMIVLLATTAGDNS